MFKPLAGVRVIDLSRVLAGDPEANLTLQAGDKLYVIGEAKQVYVEGEVKFPGTFPFTEGLRLKELLQQAELTPEASVVQASLIRKVNFEEQTIEEDPALNRLLGIPRSQRTDAEEALITLKTQQLSGRLPVDFVALMAGDERHNILLQDGDIVRIPRFVPSVRVTGAVVAPANIPYNAALTVGGYIDLAGGFNTRAKRKDIIIVEGNTGNAIGATSESIVRPGDAIFVPPREIVPGQGYRITREAIAMLGSVASLVLTIFLIGREANN
jgi:protein involved in polysaccharide export with SLBB domain